MCGIYKITNNISGKIYIGQSIFIEKRFNRHKSSAYNPMMNLIIILCTKHLENME